MTRSSSRTAALAATLAAFAHPAGALSLGAPICEVNTLPLVEMSSTLASPPPSGWLLQSRAWYQPGQPQTLLIRNSVDALKRVRGVLIWAKASQFSGAGSFALGPLYQYIPAPAECGQWAISHNSATPKIQSELEFTWTAPESGTPILRAFLIEDCGLASGDCRSYQALTPVKALYEAVFVDGLEDSPP